MRLIKNTSISNIAHNPGRVQRPARTSSSDLVRDGHDPIQQQSNLLVATWAVGLDCDPKQLASRLSKAPFDVVVLVPSTAVTATDEIFMYLLGLHTAEVTRGNRPDWDVSSGSVVLQERTVRFLGGRVFVVLHKDKIKSANYHQFTIRGRGDDYGIRFGTLKLKLNQDRQKMAGVSVGIIEVRTDDILIGDILAIKAFVVRERIAMLTGSFGNTTADFVNELARHTKAIFSRPLYQCLRCGNEVWAHPTYFLLFGFFTDTKLPKDIAAAENGPCLGDDIWADMLRVERMPRWRHNEQGNAYVPNLGRIKMMRVDFEKKWFDGCFQTCLWLGHRMEGRRRADGKGGGKGKGGKGKGKGKGKCKG